MQAAVRVVGIETARQADIRFRADIALENLGIVALRLDGAFGPILVETEHCAKVAFAAEQAGRGGALLCRHGVRIGSSDAVFLSGDQGVNGPADDVGPLIVAMTNDGTQRFLGNNFRKDQVVLGLGERGACRRQTGTVRGIGVATVGEIVLARFFVGLDRYWLCLLYTSYAADE